METERSSRSLGNVIKGNIWPQDTRGFLTIKCNVSEACQHKTMKTQSWKRGLVSKTYHHESLEPWKQGLLCTYTVEYKLGNVRPMEYGSLGMLGMKKHNGRLESYKYCTVQAWDLGDTRHWGKGTRGLQVSWGETCDRALLHIIVRVYSLRNRNSRNMGLWNNRIMGNMGPEI